MEIRKIKTTDFFTISKIASKLDIDLKAIFKQINALSIRPLEENATAEQIEAYNTKYRDNSMAITDLLIKEVFYKMHLAEREIIQLIVDLTQTSEKEIRALDAGDFFKLITQLVKDSGFVSFFK